MPLPTSKKAAVLNALKHNSTGPQLSDSEMTELLGPANGRPFFVKHFIAANKALINVPERAAILAKYPALAAAFKKLTETEK
jgi:hypothetical protein